MFHFVPLFYYQSGALFLTAQLCEASGTFGAGMFSAGGLYALGTAALLMEPLGRKINAWRESRDMVQEDSIPEHPLMNSTASPEKETP